MNGDTRSATHNAGDRTATPFSEERITLRVHPYFGQPIFILRRGSEAVWVELQDGRCTILPVEWTSLHPRPRPLKHRGRSVRLAPESLQALSRWVTARLEGEATAGRKLTGEGEKTREPLNEGADARVHAGNRSGGDAS